MNAIGNHPGGDEDFDLYVLGALDDEEKRAIETHLASCTLCSQRLAEAKGRVALLSFAAPSVSPSPAAKQRLMARIRQESSQSPWKTVASRIPESEPPPAFTSWWNRILLPLGAALALATILLWRQNHALDLQLAALRQSLDQQQHRLQDALNIESLLASRDTMTIPLSKQPGQPVGTAQVIYNKQTGMLMYAGQLAPPPAGKSYELWLVPVRGTPMSAGVFNSVNGQMDHWMAKMPPGTDPAAFAVTLEPSGGMPQPTGPKVLVGPVS